MIVRVPPEGLRSILERSEKPLVVYAEGGFLGVNYQYLTSYKGLAFFTKSRQPVQLPADIELVRAEKIWIPG